MEKEIRKAEQEFSDARMNLWHVYKNFILKVLEKYREIKPFEIPVSVYAKMKILEVRRNYNCGTFIELTTIITFNDELIIYKDAGKVDFTSLDIHQQRLIIDFYSIHIMLVSDYKEACKVLKIYPECEGSNHGSGFLLKGRLSYLIPIEKLRTIYRVLNDGWEPDWSNEQQKKWVPMMLILDGDIICSGARQVKFRCQCGTSGKLVLKTKSLAEYAGRQFIDLYKQILLG